MGHGLEMAPDEPEAELACALHADKRALFGEVVSMDRLFGDAQT